jgi:23S rRNA pseudouridine1911/1915/1917 synthase
MEPQCSFEVGPAEVGQRLDAVVARALGLSRGWVRKLLDAERVLLAGRPAAKGTILRAGDRVEVLVFARPEAGPIANPAIALPILRESEGLVAVDKPAGLPVHPLDPDETHSALNALVACHPELVGVGEGGLRSGVVHRLDPGTSGVLIFALREDAWRAARAAFAGKRVAKRYVARVHGAFAGEREIELMLENRGAHVRVVERGGRLAVSRIRALETGPVTSLVEIGMRTGVRHQIRATLAELGHPIVGDRLYGSTAELGRHWLHAASIAWNDFAAEAELPPELKPLPPGQKPDATGVK